MREKGIRRYLTTTQAARLAHLSPSTLLRAIQNKKLKAFSTPGGHFRVDRVSLEAFLRGSGVSAGKKKVLHLKLSPDERDELLRLLREDGAFAVVDGTAFAAGEHAERPCLVLLDAADGAPRKRPAGAGILSLVKKLTGLS